MTDQPSRALQFGLAFIAGIGLTLMVVVAGVAVVDTSASSASLGLWFAIGTAMLISGIIAWFIVVRPHKHFDDINVPLYHGHEHDDEHEAHPEGETTLAEQH